MDRSARTNVGIDYRTPEQLLGIGLKWLSNNLSYREPVGKDYSRAELYQRTLSRAMGRLKDMVTVDRSPGKIEKYIQIIYFINSLDIHPQIKEQATSFAKLVYHNPDSNFPLDNHSQ